jgi:hypothetical protein
MSFSDRAGAWIEAHPRVRDWIQSRLSDYPPAWLNDRTMLAGWDAAHSSPTGDVWLIAPLWGQGWELWQPGSRRGPNGSIEGILESFCPEDEDDQTSRLGPNEHWMRPWVEEVTDGAVAEFVEGLSWWGDGPTDYMYVIYVQVAP